MLIMVDVETLGPCPGLYPMTEFAAVAVWNPKEGFPLRFYGKFVTLDAEADPETLKFYDSSEVKPRVSPRGEKESQAVSTHVEVMTRFRSWLEKINKPMMISDNNGFDYSFISYYLWKYAGGNPFGHSSTNLGSLYKGAAGTMFENFKKLRKTAHTHSPIDDCLGNCEAIAAIVEKFGIKGLL